MREFDAVANGRAVAGGAAPAADPNERNLIDIVHFLREHEIDFWVDQGTLLGIVRDDALLPWDKDIDLSVWPDEFDRVVRLREELRRRGYYFELHEYKDCLFLSKEDGYFVEIGRYRVEGEMAVRKNNGPRIKPSEMAVKRVLRLLPHRLHCMLRDLGRRWHKKETILFRTPLRFYSDFRMIVFRGLELKVPAETEAYLAFKYGEDWRTPIREWDFSVQDGSVVGR